MNKNQNIIINHFNRFLLYFFLYVENYISATRMVVITYSIQRTTYLGHATYTLVIDCCTPSTQQHSTANPAALLWRRNTRVWHWHWNDYSSAIIAYDDIPLLPTPLHLMCAVRMRQERMLSATTKSYCSNSILGSLNLCFVVIAETYATCIMSWLRLWVLLHIWMHECMSWL